MYHVKDGLYFCRMNNEGVVRIIKLNKAKDVEFSIDLEPNQWASIVAFVCVSGENSYTFRQAENLHEFGRLEYPTSI